MSKITFLAFIANAAMWQKNFIITNDNAGETKILPFYFNQGAFLQQRGFSPAGRKSSLGGWGVSAGKWVKQTLLPPVNIVNI